MIRLRQAFPPPADFGLFSYVHFWCRKPSPVAHWRQERALTPHKGEGDLRRFPDQQFWPNSPSIAFSSAGLISLECATSTECSRPSSFSTQKARKRCSSGISGTGHAAQT